MSNLVRLLSVVVVIVGSTAFGQAKITSINRWQEAINPCRSYAPLVLTTTYNEYTTGYWGATQVYGRSFNGQPLSYSDSNGTTNASVDWSTYWPGDAVLGNTTGFGQITLHGKSSLSASSVGGGSCGANNFFEASSGMSVAFQVNQTEIFTFSGTIVSNTTFEPLNIFGASLVCNGTSYFNVGAGSHDLSFTLHNGDNCTFTLSGSAGAEGGFGDSSAITYDVTLKSDG